MLRPLIRPIVRPLVRGVTEPGYGSLAAQIRLLFASGEQGAWYDPSDLPSMNTKSDGSGTVPGVGDPVGYIADKSGNGKHATQSTDTSRPLLQQDAGGRYYLSFDGADDFLVTGSIDFTGSDKMTVVAGMRKSSDAARSSFMSLREEANSFITFEISAPNAALGNFVVNSVGSISREAIASAGVGTYVLCATGDISGDLVRLRINGALAAQTTLDQGTGNYRNSTLRVGRRNDNLPFNGRIYSLIVRGAASTAAEIEAAERYVNSRTGAY